jgi:hypothetical protein
MFTGGFVCPGAEAEFPGEPDWPGADPELPGEEPD